MYTVIEKAIQSIYLLSKDNLIQVLLIYINILRKEILLCYKSYLNVVHIFKFIQISNYLLNYHNIQEHYQDSFLQIVIDKALSSSLSVKNHFDFYKVIPFLFNSTLDYPLSEENSSIYPIIQQINTIILHLLTITGSIIHPLYLLSFFFILKDFLQFSDIQSLINYVFVLLLLSRPNESTIIKEYFNNYITIKPVKYNITDIKDTLLEFFYNWNDMVCYYYILFLNKKRNTNNTIVTAVNSILTNFFINKENKDNRDIIFELMLNKIISGNTKRTNIKEDEIITNIEQFRFISGRNNNIVCIKDNIMIDISPVSHLQYKTSFQLIKSEENVINTKENKIKAINSWLTNSNIDKDMANLISEDNQEIIQENLLAQLQNKRNVKETHFIHNKMISILKTPILITYHINIFFYNNEYTKITLDDLLSVHEKQYSPLYYHFISQLGDIFIDDNGNRTLSYKDSFYNIIFDFVDLKQTEEEKINLIQDNVINIIWIDNTFIDDSAIESIFTSMNPKEYIIITIIPNTDSHFLVKMHFKTSENLSNEALSNNKRVSINDFLCNIFYININENSSIRYLLNCCIIMNDWFYYIGNNSTILNDNKKGNNNELKSQTNCYISRLGLIQKINDFLYH